jgi:hypothetical protein
MARKLTIGVALHPQHTTAPELVQRFRRRTALGVDHSWTWNHVFPLTSDQPEIQRKQ